MSKVLRWFKALSTAGKAGVLLAGVIGIGVVGAATNNTPPASTTQKTAPVSKHAPVITHGTTTTTESIPFTTTDVNDATLASGTSKTTTEGVNGVRTHTFDVTYSDGVETSRTEVSSTITTQPVNQVVAIGTYVAPAQPSCPNGSYVNSAGNTVCSPSSSPTVPPGATAQCVDGTYSYSQSRSGTCSHHGGVATWL